MRKVLMLMVIGLVGCSGVSGTPDAGVDAGAQDAGGPVTAPPGCTSDADCGANKHCNARGHVCMDACSSSSDCSSGQTTCAVVTNADGGPVVAGTVCTCTTDQACGGNLYCNTIDLLCEGHCAVDADCSDFSSARVCRSGACVPGL